MICYCNLNKTKIKKKQFLSKEIKNSTCPLRPTPSNANNFNNSHPIAPQPTFITKQKKRK
jgi:hypothetical protein